MFKKLFLSALITLFALPAIAQTVATSGTSSLKVTSGTSQMVFMNDWEHNPSDALTQLFSYGGLTFYKDFSALSVGTHAESDLDADFSIGSATADFSATRSAAAPATYVDSNGVIQLVTTSDVGRIQGGYYDETGFHAQKGLMIEGSGTNYVLNSYFSLDSDADGKSNSWNASYGTFTRETCAINGITDGKSQKNIYTYSAGTGNYTYLLNTTTANDTFDASGGNIAVTLSFWARGDFSELDAASPVAWLFLQSVNNAGAYQESLISRAETQAASDGLSPTEWRRFTFSATITDTDVRKVDLRFGYFPTGTLPTAGQTAWIEVYGVQIEKSPYATSFIPTTTAALTRGAETLKYAIAGNKNASEESIFLGFAPESAFANDGINRFLISNDAPSRSMRKLSTSTQFRINFDGTVNADSSGATVSANTLYVASATFHGPTASPNMNFYLDGVNKVQSDANYNSPVWGQYFYLGVENNDAYLNGIFTKAAIFSNAKDVTAASGITTILQQ